MAINKNEIAKQIITFVKNAGKPINPSVIGQKLSWNKDYITEICKEFGKTSFNELLNSLPGLKVTKDENNTPSVTYTGNAEKTSAPAAAQASASVSAAGNVKTAVRTASAASAHQSQSSAANNTKNSGELLHDRVEIILGELGKGIYGKEEALRLTFLSLISGESIFMLGGPGCAKGLIARRTINTFKTTGDDKICYFETLLNQFSTPEDVFGNISLKALNGELIVDGKKLEKEEYRRLTDGMLPEADVAFLDEIWKANPAILNSLLTIINEKKFHNGSRVVNVPLKGLITASNELPAKNSGLEALYDRLIVRLHVDYIEDDDDFFNMVEDPVTEFEASETLKANQITNNELKDWKNKIQSVTLSETARNIILGIREELARQNEELSEKEIADGEAFLVSDRRWKKIVWLLKTSAFLNGRTQVDQMDCSLIEYCIWNTEAQSKKTKAIVENCIKENGVDCTSSLEEIKEQIEDFKAKVTETWYEKKEVKENWPKYKMTDGTMAYKIVDPKEVYFAAWKYVPYYISNEYEVGYDDRKGNLYREDGEPYGTSRDQYFENFTVSKDKVTWEDGYNKASKGYYNANPYQFEATIEYTAPVNKSVKKTYSEISQLTQQKKFDDAYYTPIVNSIDKEIADLKNKRQDLEKPFKDNLFADQDYADLILSKIDETRTKLEDAKVELEKEHKRYYNADIKIKYSVGDIILDDGTVFSSKTERDSLTEEQKERAVAVICIDGETPYGIGLKERTLIWNKANGVADDYGKNMPEGYKTNWIVPDQDKLNQIFKNIAAINESLIVLGENASKLDEKEYWSSTKHNESSACYQSFKDGKMDFTDCEHEYRIRVIRAWN